MKHWKLYYMKLLKYNFEHYGKIELKIYARLNYKKQRLIRNNKNNFLLVPDTIRWDT